ncbi:MAG: acylneuraminate cytidylyltransferase family protein [Patescibacteria group bacterium]|nr:acylneuraminate cytidylyltransferase family protein [Patescibacteria group bacterium]
MKILAVIMARGGSKGLPGKNIKPMLGKPLIAYIIEEAKKSKYIERVILSTDDDAIAGVGKQYGTEVLFKRPAELASDTATELPVVQHALKWLEDNDGYKPDIIVRLVPTSPLSKAEYIDKGIKLMLDNPDAEGVRSVVKSPSHPLKCWRLEGDNLISFIPKEVYGFKEPYIMPRQVLPKAFVNNGAVDVLKYDTIMNKNSWLGDKIYGFEMPEENSVNIDNEFDFMMAKRILKREHET